MCMYLLCQASPPPVPGLDRRIGVTGLDIEEGYAGLSVGSPASLFA